MAERACRLVSRADTSKTDNLLLSALCISAASWTVFEVLKRRAKSADSKAELAKALGLVYQDNLERLMEAEECYDIMLADHATEHAENNFVKHTVKVMFGRVIRRCEAEEAREVEEVVRLLVAGAVQRVIYTIGAGEAAELQAARQATAAAMQRSRAVELLLIRMENKVRLEAETLHRHGFRRGCDGQWGWSIAWVNEDPEAANLVSF